ncbi:MAG TPA: hypothetical protein VJK04_01530 [Candidatus Paceibacterota bacterium]
MRKVLIIANLFHASPRMPGLTTYLTEFGWQATIVTAPLSEINPRRLGFPKEFLKRTKIVEAPYRGDVLWLWRKLFIIFGFKREESITEQIKGGLGSNLRDSFVNKLLNLYQAIFGYPDTEKYWWKPAISAARPLLKRDKYDALLSSSPYPTSHMVANQLKKEFAIPWIADFRDPWSQNHAYPYGPVRKYLDKRLEKKVVGLADYITAASPSYAQKEATLVKKPTTTITNGFDPETVNDHPEKLTEKFTIMYAGSIYAGRQDPTKLFRALRELINEDVLDKNNVEVRFYGIKQVWVSEEIKHYELESIVTQYGSINREESVMRQRESQILLLLCWEDLSDKSVYPLKFFEYLAARRPILATGGSKEEDVKGMIKELNCGVNAAEVKDIKESLKVFYSEYKSRGAVSYQGDTEKISRHSYRDMARKFADILNEITKK